MTKEKLEELLNSGAITQEEFDEMVQSIKDPDPTTEPTKDSTKDPEPEDITKTKEFQREIDKHMSAERKKNVDSQKKNAELQRKIERLEKKILTDEELQRESFEQQQQELEEQRKELKYEKNKMYAVKSMQKAEINGSEEAMLLMEKLVMVCEDEADIDDVISSLKAWKDKEVKAEVDKRFKEGGSTPKKGDNLGGGVNPYKKETFNLTEQIRLEQNNPELAARYKAEAGIK